MKLRLQLIIFACSFSIILNAQSTKSTINNTEIRKTCGTVVPSKEWNEAFNKKVEEYNQSIKSGKSAIVNYTIPCIVHLVHGGQPVGTFPNLSQAQINSQISVLNADFSGTGFGVANLAATAFSAVGAANCNIQFCLATKNEKGQTLPEPGIDRIDFNTKGWTNPATIGSQQAFRSFIDGTVKPATIWNPSHYLNIWVTSVNPGNNLLGYATFPLNAALIGSPGGGSATTDGIWVENQCFGNVGALNSNYNKGRTATHEVGHWLGLRHIGGDGEPGGTGAGVPGGDCTATDYCNDTPPQKGGFSNGQFGQNFGVPTYPLFATGASSCSGAPNGCMFMNFMDYCEDIALNMFTPDQRTRMQTAMSTGFYRTTLNAASATLCSNPPSAPVVVASMPSEVCNTLAVVSTTNDASTGNPIPTFSWSSSPAAGVNFSPSSTTDSPTITFASNGTYTITCEGINSVGTNSAVMTISVTSCEIGIEKHYILKNYVSLQPNPSNGKVSLITTLPNSQTIQISIQSVLGQNITTSINKGVTNKVFELDLTDYPNGVYFVTINNGSEKVVKRLVLNK